MSNNVHTIATDRVVIELNDLKLAACVWHESIVKELTSEGCYSTTKQLKEYAVLVANKEMAHQSSTLVLDLSFPEPHAVYPLIVSFSQGINYCFSPLPSNATWLM